MKKIISLFLICICLCTALTGCQKKYTLDKVENFTLDKIEFKTEDGTWSSENVEEMIDMYYYDRSNHVLMDISITITVAEDFQFAYFICQGGIYEIRKASVIPCTYTKTLGSSLRKDGAIKAGTYTVEIEDVEFSFYEKLSTDDEVITPSLSKINLAVDAKVYKYYKG